MGQKREYSCIMAKLHIPNWKSILDCVDKEDLFEGKGLEEEAHVTILYGIESFVPIETITEIVRAWNSPSLTFREVSLFENKEFDVLKINVESFELGALRQQALVLDNEQSFPMYHPHATIAYLKKGTGQKYLLKEFPKVNPVVCDFKVSTSEGQEIYFKPKLKVLNYNSYIRTTDKQAKEVMDVMDSKFVSGYARIEDKPDVKNKE